MMDYMERSGFYEDDEPVDEIIQAYEAGVKGRTGRPQRGRTQFLDLDFAIRESQNQPVGEPSGELGVHIA